MNKLTPDLMVKDVNKTVEFYRDVLGFQYVMGVPTNSQEICAELPQDKQLAFALMKNGNAEIMFQQAESLSADIAPFKGMKIGASVSFYFDVDNIGDYYESLKGKTEIVKELHTTWYGMQEFYIRDCNGYILGFSKQAQK
jgi:uncharacterized glyoxalase superfamily protein PhnB